MDANESRRKQQNKSAREIKKWPPQMEWRMFSRANRAENSGGERERLTWRKSKAWLVSLGDSITALCHRTLAGHQIDIIILVRRGTTTSQAMAGRPDTVHIGPVTQASQPAQSVGARPLSTIKSFAFNCLKHGWFIRQLLLCQYSALCTSPVIIVICPSPLEMSPLARF